MRYDWTPLWRSTIGFDRLFNALDEVQRTAEEAYPPYNIERLDENRFQISVALAGFTPEEVALTSEQNVLTLEGRKSEKEEQELPPSRHLGAQLQAAVHARRSRRGQGRPLRTRPARHQPAARDSRSDEAAPDRHQWRRARVMSHRSKPRPPENGRTANDQAARTPARRRQLVWIWR